MTGQGEDERRAAAYAGTLEGLVCAVTGAGSGIGRVCAAELARRGARVAVIDRNGALADSAAGDIGPAAAAFRCDVTDSADVEAVMRDVHARFGRIDALHNNAGIHETGLTDRCRLEQLDERVFDAVCDVNMKGTWLCMKHAAPYLRASRGCIVNASSVSGLTGYESAGTYCATKAAVIALTRAAAIEMADAGVRVNCYCPAAADTPMARSYVEHASDPAGALHSLTATHLVPRLAEPADVADLVCFLVSDQAAFINGATVVIDGGSLAWRGTR